MEISTGQYRVFFSLVMVCLALIRPSNALATPLSRTITIQDAIQQGLVEASADSTDGMGFRQPMVFLHIINKSTSVLTITIPLGTQLIASQQNYATMVTGESLNCNSDPQAELNLSLNVFSLSYKLSFPFKSDLNNNRYTIGNIVQGKIIRLLKAIDGHAEGTQYGSQLAVWSISMGKPMDQIASELNASPVDKTNGQQMLAFVSNSPSTSLILIILLVVAVIVAAGLSLKDILRSKPLKRTTFPHPSDTLSPPQPIVHPGIPKESNAPITEESGVDPMRKTENPPDSQTSVVHLVGVSGAYADRKLDLKVPSIIGRGDFEWIIFEDDTVSTPHAILDLTEAPYRIKDLNSKTGVDLENIHLDNRFTDFEPGQKIRIGSFVVVFNNDTLEIVDGPKAGIIIGHSADLVVISNRKYDSIALGLDDMRVSDAHAILYKQNGEVLIRDLNSSNGTMVNSKRVNIDTVLKPGDKLGIGTSEFLVELK